MNTTVQQIFDMAIHLMDEQNEQNGETQTIDTDEYRYRTLSILNTYIPRLSIYSKEVVEPGVRENFLRQETTPEGYKNPDFQQSIPLDDNLAMALLPYALGAELQATENPELAAWMKRHYDEAFYELKDKNQPGTWEKIKTPYGLF